MLFVAAESLEVASANLSTTRTIVELVYLLAAVGFVMGLHLMRSPATARKGNLMSAAGMTLAVAMTSSCFSATRASTSSRGAGSPWVPERWSEPSPVSSLRSACR
jgi:hypothetical protein